jgi:hypothetical protein
MSPNTPNTTQKYLDMHYGLIGNKKEKKRSENMRVCSRMDLCIVEEVEMNIDSQQ